MEIATRNGIYPCSEGLAQAHPLMKPPAMSDRPSAGLGPGVVHPTHSGVCPRIYRTWNSARCYIVRHVCLHLLGGNG